MGGAAAASRAPPSAFHRALDGVRLRCGVPWGWGKKAPAPVLAADPPQQPGQPGGAVPAPTPLPGDAPLANAARFRVDDVYTITGLGCVLVGEVEEGSIRPPVPMRILHVVDGAEEVIPVQVVSVMAHRQPVAELFPGTPAGLQLRGLREDRSPLARSRYPVGKGDRLVSP